MPTMGTLESMESQIQRLSANHLPEYTILQCFLPIPFFSKHTLLGSGLLLSWVSIISINSYQSCPLTPFTALRSYAVLIRLKHKGMRVWFCWVREICPWEMFAMFNYVPMCLHEALSLLKQYWSTSLSIQAFCFTGHSRHVRHSNKCKSREIYTYILAYRTKRGEKRSTILFSYIFALVCW